MPTYNPTVDLYQIKMFWTTTISSQPVDHVHQIWVRPNGSFAVPGTPADNVEVLFKDGLIGNARDATRAYLDLIEPFYSTDGATGFMNLEVWSNPANSANQTFISSAGATFSPTNVAPTEVASQLIFTHRTQSGGVLKLAFAETSVAQGSPLDYSAGSSSPALADLATYMTGLASLPCDRRGTYTIATLGAFPGQNEATFKERFR